MKESDKEDLANHFGHESYADDGNVVGVATAVVYAGKLLSSEITHTECRKQFVGVRPCFLFTASSSHGKVPVWLDLYESNFRTRFIM
jgi:hypothetical protein